MDKVKFSNLYFTFGRRRPKMNFKDKYFNTKRDA